MSFLFFSFFLFWGGSFIPLLLGKPDLILWGEKIQTISYGKSSFHIVWKNFIPYLVLLSEKPELTIGQYLSLPLSLRSHFSGHSIFALGTRHVDNGVVMAGRPLSCGVPFNFSPLPEGRQKALLVHPHRRSNELWWKVWKCHYISESFWFMVVSVQTDDSCCGPSSNRALRSDDNWREVAGVAQWLKYQTRKRVVASSIPESGSNLAYPPSPWRQGDGLVA